MSDKNESSSLMERRLAFCISLNSTGCHVLRCRLYRALGEVTDFLLTHILVNVEITQWVILGYYSAVAVTALSHSSRRDNVPSMRSTKLFSTIKSPSAAQLSRLNESEPSTCFETVEAKKRAIKLA